MVVHKRALKYINIILYNTDHSQKQQANMDAILTTNILY